MAFAPVIVTHPLNASPEAVFQAWTQPEQVRQWWCTPGYCFRQIEINPVPTGRYRFEVAPEGAPDDAEPCVVSGQFLEVRAPETLVYSWTMQAPGFHEPDTLITLSLQAQDGQTLLTLTQTGFGSQESRDLHAKDWPLVLLNLEELLQRQAMRSASAVAGSGV